MQPAVGQRHQLYPCAGCAGLSGGVWPLRWGIIGAAQVDKFGNVNTTGIWQDGLGEHYRAPDTRLTGAGGANDIACGAGRVVIMVSHEAKRFAERVDYISSPGYLEGGNARARHGFVGGGPSAIVTTLGVLRPSQTARNLC